MEVGLDHAAGVDRDPLVQRGGQALDDRALDLGTARAPSGWTTVAQSNAHTTRCTAIRPAAAEASTTIAA